jgi:hypothetical protein
MLLVADAAPAVHQTNILVHKHDIVPIGPEGVHELLPSRLIV